MGGCGEVCCGGVRHLRCVVVVAQGLTLVRGFLLEPESERGGRAVQCVGEGEM